MPYSYDEPRPAVSVAAVIVRFHERLEVLLRPRAESPFKGRLELPCARLGIEEGLREKAGELVSEIGFNSAEYLLQTGAWADVARDPREREIAVSYLVCAPDSRSLELKGGWSWFGPSDMSCLAFDHLQIVNASLGVLKRESESFNALFWLMPEAFSLRELASCFEAISGVSVDKRNFRRKVFALGVLMELGIKESRVAHRKAQLYKVDKTAAKARCGLREENMR